MHQTALLTLAFASTFVLGDNINGWTGCAPDQKGVVTQAYKDALRLADHVDPFKGHDELFTLSSPNETVDASKIPDELSIRFFGQQTSAGSSQAQYVGCMSPLRLLSCSSIVEEI